ncbi:MAG: triose-phosphate isomerase [Phycisphaerales bacterium]|nr:triose-phosphate isomerase [Phycisphaerales bacterium]
MTRRPMVGGNWKMHLDAAAATALATDVAGGIGADSLVDVAVFPPTPYLHLVAEIARGAALQVGGQDASGETQGAYTGQTAASMLFDVGCSWALVGHSERRHGLGEDDALASRKVRAALDAGLRVLLCVGETLEEREAGRTFPTVCGQFEHSLHGIQTADLERIDIAYEPVWAIGTGRTAGPSEAQEVHAALRETVALLYDARSAERIRILYGGSVKPANAQALMACEDVDGALVGGASLESEPFLDIVRAAFPPEHS